MGWHPRKFWTDEDDALLIKLYDVEELSPTLIAQRMGRRVSSVAQRLTNLRKDGRIGPARGSGGRSPRG